MEQTSPSRAGLKAGGGGSMSSPLAPSLTLAFLALSYLFKRAEPLRRAAESDSEATTLAFCAECRWPNQRLEGVDVTVAARPTGEPLNSFLRRGLGWPIGDSSNSWAPMSSPLIFISAECSIARSRLIDDWVTYRGKHPLVVRGMDHVGSRTCQSCGRNLYFATGQRYLHPTPPADIPLFQSDLLGLIMPAELLEQVSLTRGMRRNVRIERLPVLNPPPDGLGDIPFFAERW